MDSIVYILAALPIVYITFQALVAFRLYTRPSSLTRYLHDGSYALITGASDGIGYGFAEELLSRGSNVILHGRNPKKVSALRDRLQAEYPGRNVRMWIADASSFHLDDISRFVREMRDEALRLTILVNNIANVPGTPTWAPFAERKPEDLDRSLDVNARFVMQLTSALLPVLTQHQPALILTLGSVGGLVGVPFNGSYAACKAFDMMFSTSLRLEMKLAQHDVEVLGLMTAEVSSAGNPKELGLFVPSSRSFAQSALNRVGCGLAVVTPVFAHQVQVWFSTLAPRWFVEKYVMAEGMWRQEEERKGN